MTPVQGIADSLEAEDMLSVVLQVAAVVNGNGTVADFSGYTGTASVEIINTGTGSATCTLEGSFDQVNWYAIGFMQIDGQANPTRAAAGIAVGATPFAHIYALLDAYNFIRARISGAAGSLALTATLRGVPV
jgi:hypothetical protein